MYKVGLRGGGIHAIPRVRPGFPRHTAPTGTVLFRSGEGTTMLQKRTESDDEGMDRCAQMAALETGRSVAESSGEKPPEPKKEEEHVSLFWRIFGGTILSIVALV